MSRTLFAGIDAGTTVIKGIIVDETGQVVRRHSVKAEKPITPEPGYAEVDPEAYFSSFSRLFNDLFKGLSGYDVYLGLSAMAPVLIPVDRNGSPLMNGLLYNDARTWREQEDLKREYGDLILRVNGNPVNQQQWLPKILWLKRNKPKVLENAWKLLDLTSYLVYRLTGETVVDSTVMLEEGFLDYRTKKLSGAILDIVGLDENKLPWLASTVDAVGKIHNGNNITLNAGTVDSIAGAVSLGLMRENILAIILGTTGIIFYSTKKPIPSSKLLIDLSPVPDLYYVCGATSSAGSFVDFMLDLLNLTGKHHILGSVLRRTKPGAGGLVALPYLVGERTPIMDPRARSIFFGISNTTTREDTIRASVEAVAYSIRHNVDEIEKLGYKTNITLVTGGMTKTPKIVQILANVLNKKIYLVSEASEPLGDTIVAKVMSGLYKWSDFMGNIPMRKIFYPKKERAFVYQELYQKYLKIYENLKDIF